MTGQHRTAVSVRADDVRRGDVVRISGEPHSYSVTGVVRTTVQPFARLVPAHGRAGAGTSKRAPLLSRLTVTETACTCALAGALGGLHDNGYGTDPELPVCRVPSSPAAVARRQRMSDDVDDGFARAVRDARIPEPTVAELLALSRRFGNELRTVHADDTLREYGVI